MTQNACAARTGVEAVRLEGLVFLDNEVAAEREREGQKY
jgi:hypothetical protein